MATAKRKMTKKKVSSKKAKTVKLKSFKLAKEPTPFVTYKITEQTFYWSILLILILILALWILQLQVNVSEILDSIKTV